MNEFAPWAIPFITEWTSVEPISCRSKDGRLFLHGDDLHTMNHWVAGVTEDGIDLYMSMAEDGLKLGDDDQFFEFYEDRKLHVFRTVTDGDCAIDTMCMILGWSRTFAMRQKLRSELAKFVYMHRSNRALIWMLGYFKELSQTLGCYEIEASGRELFEHHSHDGAIAHSHCHGGEVALQEADRLQLAVPVQKDFSEEEIAAVIWKCRLHKATHSYIVNMMASLPPAVIDKQVAIYRSALAAPVTAKTKTTTPPFLLTRDRNASFKAAAVEHFFAWTEKEHGTEILQKMKTGKAIPRGLFVSYVRSHDRLLKHCSNRNGLHTASPDYINILRRYMTAVRLHLEQPSRRLAVTTPLSRSEDTCDASQSVVAVWTGIDANPNWKHRNTTERKGTFYESHAAKHVTDDERRRLHHIPMCVLPPPPQNPLSRGIIRPQSRGRATPVVAGHHSHVVYSTIVIVVFVAITIVIVIVVFVVVVITIAIGICIATMLKHPMLHQPPLTLSRSCTATKRADELSQVAAFDKE